jgi:predicted O-methyltransferase YrrM
MKQDLFERIDAYIDKLFVPADPVLDAGVARARKAGMPEIQISAGQGKFLNLLAKMIGARRILELGTLAGYSTIWLARALPPEGRLVSLEFSPEHAKVARGNIAAAGVSERVEVIVGPALETLPKLAKRGEAPFDLVFIDADKGNYTAYLDLCVPLTRPGGLILADNVIRDGRVLAPGSDASAIGAAAFNVALAADGRLEAIVLQQVGIKGHDGLAIARVK